jgi:ParB family chromosome partitioning protein
MSDQYLALPLALLSPDPHQPRHELESDNRSVTEAATLQGLANSIREVGILQPIRVHAVAASDGSLRYTIVSGQRRYEAARMVGLNTVPCLIVDNPANASHTLVSQVTENLQRKAMTATELALAVQSLVQAGASQDEVAKRLGIQPSQVTLLLNLLVLSGPVKSAFAQGRIESPRAAYDLNKLPPALQEQLIGESAQKGRIVTQRDVREVKQLHAKRLSQVRHRYETPAVTKQEYEDFQACIADGVVDSYDPTHDRDAVFGNDWLAMEAQQAGLGLTRSADTVDALRVRVPGFTLEFDQVGRLFTLLGRSSWAMGMQTLPDAEECKQIGKDLAYLLSNIHERSETETD